jgi:crotonobetainyl-CoA:carnitine CoA-transferase CaiB-like acyl-CoA transferase
MARVANHQALNEVLRPIFLTRTSQEWLQRLEAADVPHAPILSLADMLENDQVRHMQIERVDHHPEFGAVRSIARAIAFDGDRAGFEFSPAPGLDEHGEEIRDGFAASSLVE